MSVEHNELKKRYMMIGYADVDDTHTSFEETTSVLFENIKQLIVAMGTDEKFALLSSSQHKKTAPPHYRYIVLGRSLRMLLSLIDHYIMPPMPGLAIGISGLSSFLSQITHSVVRNMPATEAAFSRATRVTLAGSTTPAARKSPNSSVFAL